MRRIFLLFLILFAVCTTILAQPDSTWIRINQLGYTPHGIKVAVWCSKSHDILEQFNLVDTHDNKVVFTGKAGSAFGAYGPFRETYRLNFSSVTKPGNYYLQAGDNRSPVFRIAEDVYKGTADFCLRYMRQQRTGFNPFLKDSCHNYDGYTLYGEGVGLPDSSRVDVVGGWHDASDYLQYAATSANAVWHLLAAYRDFSFVFTDEKMANGLHGKNGLPDVLDEGKWGLDWLLKMHPAKEIMFNQIADDRDHQGMRMPAQDSFYGRGFQRPVYFVTGEPQQRGKFLNNTTGTSSTAAKFSSAFALGAIVFDSLNPGFSKLLAGKAFSAFNYAEKKLGYTQTASVRAPYIYAEENWYDDMELAASELAKLEPGTRQRFKDTAWQYARREPITPWLGKDTASHYQWYPFTNPGHYEFATQDHGNLRDSLASFYRKGILAVWERAKHNAFFRGVPFIWCSNNLTTSFALQCFWYKSLTGDTTFDEFAQANVDWLFGCNPWGTSMVYGLPAYGDTPSDPHSSFTHLKNYPIDGGLVDGPVYGNIFNNLIGLTLHNVDEYSQFQSDLAVYHDDYGDYSTNEPTMDGTASLVYLLASKEGEVWGPDTKITRNHGAIVRGDSSRREIALMFSGDEFGEGGNYILKSLKDQNVRGNFFFTGNFLRDKAFAKLIRRLISHGHYIGPHSDQHLLYCDWANRDSLLVSEEIFSKDLANNYRELKRFGIEKSSAKYFLPPYEWYNDSISSWANRDGVILINYTPGTLSHADYTTSHDKNYRSTGEIYKSIIARESKDNVGLNGFLLLMHVGAGPNREDKFYKRLHALITFLKEEGYRIVRIDELLK